MVKAKSSAKAEKTATVSYPVVDMKGKEVGTVELDSTVFAAPLLQGVVFDAVMWQLSKRRQGTHSTLTKGVMRGGNKKPWRQKGTGRARAGSNTSPVWVGGAVAHGPKSNPFGYETRLSKRSRRQAMAAALTDKVNKKALVVVDNFSVSSGKTKDMSKCLAALGCTGKKTALMLANATCDSKEFKASRNLENVEIFSPEGLSVMQTISSHFIVASKADVLSLQEAILKRMESSRSLSPNKAARKISQRRESRKSAPTA